MIPATIEGEALARVAFNALAFIPKATKVPLIRVQLDAGRIEITGSDSYAAGKDSAQVYNGPGRTVVFSIERDGLVEIEGFARAYKKDALALSIDSKEFNVASSEETLSVTHYPLNHVEVWQALDAMFATLEGGLNVAFDPSLFGRFGKVKSASDRVADYHFTDAERPALVKVGGTFTGLVMPLYREPAAVAAGPEGLW